MGKRVEITKLWLAHVFKVSFNDYVNTSIGRKALTFYAVVKKAMTVKQVEASNGGAIQLAAQASSVQSSPMQVG